MNTTTTAQNRKVARRHSHRAGLRTVGFIEALKGVLALIAALILTRMIRHDVDFENAAEHVLTFLHISLNHHLSQQFLDAADKLSDAHVATIFGFALVYAAIRFVEGYGLWKQRAWAEWLAIASGCIYIPFEIEKLARHPNQFHFVILAINVIVVLYIAWVRWDEIKAAHEAKRFAD